MSIRLKTLLVVLLTGVMLSVVLGVLLQATIVKDYKRIERDYFAEDLQRARAVVINYLVTLGEKTTDWAEWEETYAFVGNDSPGYAERNLNAASFQSIDIEAAFYYGENASLQAAAAFDIKSGAPLSTENYLAAIKANGIVERVIRNKEREHEIVRDGSTVLLVAANSILNGVKEEQSRGVLIFMRRFSPDLVRKLNSVVKLPFTIAAKDNPAEHPAVEFAPPQSDWISGHAIIRDKLNRPEIELHLGKPRTLYSSAIRTAWTFVGLTFLLSVAIAFVTLILLEAVVLRRLSRLSQAIDSIRVANDPTLRLPVEGRDEIAALGANGNLMLEDLQRSHQELLEREAHLRAAKDKAEDAARSKSKFLATMSHELRTPLNAIIGISTSLQDENPSLRKDLEIVLSAADHLHVMLSDILDLSKIEAGRLTISPVNANVVPAIRKITAPFDLQCSAKGIEWILVLDDNLPTALVVDIRRLTQIVFNLISNSLRHTEHGAILFRLSAALAERQEVLLRGTVIDTGCGIDQATQQNLFEDFSHGRGATLNRNDGTGLGLPICAHLCQLMGGQITLRSRVDIGTAVCFTIKCKVEGRDSTTAPEGAETLLPPLRILVAEDNSVNQLVAKRLLAAAGHHVTMANDGIEAVELFKAQPFDIVLLDLEMPRLDGYGAAIQLRELERLAGTHTPIVAVSAFVLADEQKRCQEVGMDGFVAKPVTKKALYDALGRYCRRPISSRLPT